MVLARTTDRKAFSFAEMGVGGDSGGDIDTAYYKSSSFAYKTRKGYGIIYVFLIKS